MTRFLSCSTRARLSAVQSQNLRAEAAARSSEYSLSSSSRCSCASDMRIFQLPKDCRLPLAPAYGKGLECFALLQLLPCSTRALRLFAELGGPCMRFANV